MKTVQLLILALIVPVLTSGKAPHEYYVSVTSVEYDEESKSLQMISQIFIDDFETLIRQRYNDSITLAGINEPAVVNSYMQRYLSDKLTVQVNGETIKFNFLGKEYKDDITYCYLEAQVALEIKSISITNQVLFDVFEDQQNIVRLKLLDKNKSFLLVPDQDECMLNFD